MSTLKISYNNSEISCIDVTAPVTITYNDSTICTLSDGDIKALCCDGKVMESDVIIATKTLNCSGKLMQGDIVVELVGSAPSGGETWYFNETIDPPEPTIIVFNFICKDVSFNGIRYHPGSKWMSASVRYLQSNADGTEPKEFQAYQFRSGWLDTSFRTIVLNEPATGDALTYLQANATKIS